VLLRDIIITGGRCGFLVTGRPEAVDGGVVDDGLEAVMCRSTVDTSVELELLSLAVL